MNPRLQDASLRQRSASDPESSAWVSANAGSGKTHVLAQRVVRLLLTGAKPSCILCLTFTKAAAANMADRVFNRLAKWTKLDDEALTTDIIEIGAPKPSRPDLEAARKLFARVIETPGGLKIQTIHAFCERVLHLFPFEANVPAGFRPLDEREAALTHQRAQARMFARAVESPELAAAIERVAQTAGPEGFGPLLSETARLGEALALHGSPERFAEKLAERLGLVAGEDEAAIARAMREDGGGPARWREWARALRQGSVNDQRIASVLTGAAEIGDAETSLETYLQAFLTRELGPRKNLATRATNDRFPDVVEALYAERERLVALVDKRRAAKAVAQSRDLYRISTAAEAAYARAKAARAALDFDDLIDKTEALLRKSNAAWILYKLDAGVEHILVDEAQDTSRKQWSILAKLAEDFLSGASAGSSRRTFFAVGDEKQSIFSFQGAAPHLFDWMKRFFARRHAGAKRPFVDVQLVHSFRSAPHVLDAVDKVFSAPEVWRGVSVGEATAPPHFAIHEQSLGVVEFWPPIASEAAAEPEGWRLPLDAERLTHPAVALAERIAGVISQWLAPGSAERVADPRTGALRPIQAGDILILVRSRSGPLFDALTRSLRRARVATAGADRLMLAQHIAVLDLCASARAALHRDDDLSLAAVLKSPLIGLDDDDLIKLAPQRTGPLAAALAADPAYAAVQAKLELWRRRAASLGPFDFFARLLGPDGGRRALVGRLGSEAGDALDEFLARALAHERGEAPSLTGFLEEIEAADSEIKRDMDAAGEQVRVMTVHASKGLEAPIVILPDTNGAPNGRHDPKWLRLASASSTTPPLYVWGGPAAGDSQEVAKARVVVREAAAGEHRRLLYVAMTRAAQRLVVAGFEGARASPLEAWANLIPLGLAAHFREVPSWWDTGEKMLRLGEGARGEAPRAESAPAAALTPPDWLTSPARKETVYTPLSPSRRLAGNVGAERLSRIEEGRLAHRLLQSLPKLSPERRRDAAGTFLARHGAMLSEARRQALVNQTMALIELPEAAPLFGPGSRAEVPIAASLARAGGERVTISARIDRLAVMPDQVWIADFKSGPAVPTAEHTRQLALYRAAVHPMFPGADIRVFLLWIDSGRLQELGSSSLDEAYEHWSLDG